MTRQVRVPAAEEVDEGIVFRQPDRIVVRQEHNRCADADPRGALGDGRGDDLRRGANIAIEVVLADPHAVKPEFFGVGHFGEEILIILGLGAVLGVVIEERQQAKFHHLTAFRFYAARHCMM